MLARFFIDRPVFAWVLSIVIFLVGLMAVISLRLREPIRPGLVRRSGEPHLAAEIVHARRDSQIIGRDDDVGQNLRRRHAAVHVLDHRTAVEIGERLAGKPCRSVSGGDDGDDAERRNRIDS